MLPCYLNNIYTMSLPIRILGQLGYKNLEILRGMFPHLQQRKFTRIDDFYELLIYCKTYLKKMLANSSMKLLLCHKLMSFMNFQPKKEFCFFMAMINRIYRVLNPLPNSGRLVPRLITARSFNQQSIYSIKFHAIYPIMAVGCCATSSITIWQIKSDNTFENVFTFQHLSNCAIAFHPILPIMASGLNGSVMLVKFNNDFTRAQILNTTRINKGANWSIIFHLVQPVIYISNDYGYLMVLQFTPDFSVLLSESLLKPHTATINGIAISRDFQFIATCSDDCTAKISSFDADDCTKIKTEASFTTHRKILCIAIHPQLDLVAFGSNDQSARIYQINKDFTTVCIKILSHPSGVRCVKFDPFNWTLMTGCYDGYVRIWNYEGEEKNVRDPINQFKKSLSTRSSVISIGFSPNRPRILAIGDNEEMTIMKLE
jgi:WD40 repeat protein